MAHSLLTLIRDLHRRRARERRGLALVEGVRLVEEALAAGAPLRGAVTGGALEGTGRGRALKAALLASGAEVLAVPDPDLARLAATDQPQGVVAVVEAPGAALGRVPVGPGAVLVVLDALQDPGNVGTVVRTALAFGAAGVVALPGTAELANPKTLRATMGACFRIPLAAAPEAEVAAWLARHGVTVVAAAMDGEPFDPAGLPRPLALVLGNEGAGARSALAAGAARRVTIPVAAGVESLNVAVAAGILLHGVARGR
jgi:RNA methyltransferase, TrmH family